MDDERIRRTSRRSGDAPTEGLPDRFAFSSGGARRKSTAKKSTSKAKAKPAATKTTAKAPTAKRTTAKKTTARAPARRAAAAVAEAPTRAIPAPPKDEAETTAFAAETRERAAAPT